jgi:hypothetical protein
VPDDDDDDEDDDEDDEEAPPVVLVVPALPLARTADVPQPANEMAKNAKVKRVMRESVADPPNPERRLRDCDSRVGFESGP